MEKRKTTQSNILTKNTKDYIEKKLNEEIISINLHDSQLINYVIKDDAIKFRFCLSCIALDDEIFGEFYMQDDSPKVILDLEINNIIGLATDDNFTTKYNPKDYFEVGSMDYVNSHDKNSISIYIFNSESSDDYLARKFEFSFKRFRWSFISDWNLNKYNLIPYEEQQEIFMKTIGHCTL